MHSARVVERRPSDWVTSLLVVLWEATVFFALGYYARPEIERWLMSL